MFKIIQSHRTENLVDYLLKAYQAPNQNIFEPFVVIVPSKVLGDWLDKTIASRAGISTLVTTKFWGEYQWKLMQDVLSVYNHILLTENPNAKTLNVPDVPVLSPTVMQWRLFGYLTYYQKQIINDEKHPLYPLLSPLIDDESVAVGNQKNTEHYHSDPQQEARIWQLASDLARVFNRYLTHRDDWLAQWSNNKPLHVDKLIAEKDSLSLRFDKYARTTPPWLVDHYVELESAQRYLWTQLFAGVHQYRVELEESFWRALEQASRPNTQFKKVLSKLPDKLRIFTIQQLPQTELDFLQKLSLYMDITLLHYNPSKLFWADIVDKSWLQRQQIINPENVFLRDYGHSLLSRLGKQSRDTFAMLANLSGNEQYKNLQIEWYDDFSEKDSESTQPSLLKQLQNDVLMLDEQSTQQATVMTVSQAMSQQLEQNIVQNAWYEETVLENKHFKKERNWGLSSQDNSLSIHSCHNLQRQLEILRIMIGRWLNEPQKEGAKPRHISDIVVLLPDVERHHALISSIFVNGKGQDELMLPAKITGVVDASIRQLWEAIIGFYKLLGSDSARFEATEVMDWLMLPPLYQSFGLTHEQMSRACDLLVEAGYIRGFDEQHLKQTLDQGDFDYRFSFAQALDRLTLGLVMPEAQLSDCLYPLEPTEWPNSSVPEMTLPLPQVSLNDAPIIDALCRIYAGLLERRGDHLKTQTAEEWLKDIETCVIHGYFEDVDQTRSMRAIYDAMNGFKSSLRANRQYKQYASSDHPTDIEIEQTLAQVETLPLKLNFMLDSIESELESQQVSAEPTGVITFGRFGALRNVPFDLVVMLNMDLSEFPARDRDNRYDLMKATLSRRGDRVSEDDDNGAFLDALLCARSACWIFYNGQSLTDTHEHLPANPVSELLQFLQGEVQWRVNGLEPSSQDALLTESNTQPETSKASDTDIKEDTTAERIRQQMPRLVKQWLVTEHPALPFDRHVFEIEAETDLKTDIVTDNQQQSLDEYDENNTEDKLLDKLMRNTKLAQKQQFPPAPLWQAVYQTLNTRTMDGLKPRVQLPTQHEYQVMANLFGNQLGEWGQIDDKTMASLADMLTESGTFKSSNERLKFVQKTLFDIQEIDVEGVLPYQVRHPAHTFLRAQELHIVQGEDALAHHEPLFLDSLSTYQIKSHLIQQLAHEKPSFTHYLSDESSETSSTQYQKDNQVLMYQKIMPAGVARYTTLPNQMGELQLLCAEFKQQLIDNDIEISSSNTSTNDDDATDLALISPTSEYPVNIDLASIVSGLKKINKSDADAASANSANEDSNSLDNSYTQGFLALLPKRIKMKGLVPLSTNSADRVVEQSAGTPDDSTSQLDVKLSYVDQSPARWLNILPNSASPRHLLKFWLSHLYWQVARRTTSEQVVLNDGISIWRFNKPSSQVKKYENTTVYKLPPIVYETAVVELIKWAVFANLSGQVPLTLLPDYALNYLEFHHKAQEEQQGNYWPKRAHFTAWIRPNYNANGVYDTCSQHPTWQYILRDQDAFKALSDSLTTLAEPLYDPMFKLLKSLDR